MICLFGEKLKRNKMNYRLNNRFGNKSNNKLGFTLLEMIVSMAVIILITAVFIANYSSSNKRVDLVMTAQKLVADIHAAQNNTLGLVKYGAEVPLGGWGVHFDLNNNPRQYTVFADLNRPASNEPGQIWPADSGFMLYDEGEGDNEKGARVVNLSPGLIIDSLVVGSSTATSMANITFLPPDPKTNIFNGIITFPSLLINIKEESSGIIKTIRVNFLGLVEVIN